MNGTVMSALARASRMLAMAGVSDPARDARLLMAATLEMEPGRLTLLLREPLSEEAAATFAGLVSQRERRQPIAQILGRRAFWGRDFEVTRDVLDPRPETETLILRALEGAAPDRVIDLGTGSGAILVTLLCEWSGARGLGTDTSAAALGVAARNAERHGVIDRADFRCADWTDGITARFDLVVCNPPYVPAGEIAALAPDVREWEPHAALTAGPTGFEAYGKLAAQIGAIMAPGGRVLLEIGAGQGAAVMDILRGAGLARLAVHVDLDGRERVVEAYAV